MEWDIFLERAAQLHLPDLGSRGLQSVGDEREEAQGQLPGREMLE